MIGYPNESVVSYKYTAAYRMRMIALGAVVTFLLCIWVVIRSVGTTGEPHRLYSIPSFIFTYIMYYTIFNLPHVIVWEYGIIVRYRRCWWDDIESANINDGVLHINIKKQYSHKPRPIKIRLDRIERSDEMLDQIREKVAVS